MEKGKGDRLRELRRLIRDHDERYYRDARPTIGDREYDSLKRELEGLERELDPLGLFKTEDASRDSEQKSISFFESNDDCPTCKQDIDHAFKHKEISEKQEKIKKFFSAQTNCYVTY